jgi:hypothetical protein
MIGMSSGPRTASFITGGAYGVLLLVGAVEGAIGSFQYSRMAPTGAILFDVGIFATCLLAAWAMGSFSGAFTPALGWVIASFVLSMPMSNGSVIIAATTAGKWYLYGGTVSIVAALVVAFGGWLKGQHR